MSCKFERPNGMPNKKCWWKSEYKHSLKSWTTRRTTPENFWRTVKVIKVLVCQQTNCKPSSLLNLTVRVLLWKLNLHTFVRPTNLIWLQGQICSNLIKYQARSSLKTWWFFSQTEIIWMELWLTFQRMQIFFKWSPKMSPTNSRKSATTLLPEIYGLFVVVWIVGGRWHWFLGYIKEQRYGCYLIDHLEGENNANDFTWKYPLAENVHNIETHQIIPVKVLRDWNVARNVCHMRFWVKNAAGIAKKFHTWLIMTYVVVIFWWSTVNHKMGVFSLSESEVRGYMIIYTCTVCMSNGFMVKNI